MRHWLRLRRSPALHGTMPFLLVIIAAFAAFHGVLGHGFVDFDDGLLIYKNPVVHVFSPATIWRAWTSYDPELYIPLTLLSLQWDWMIGGGSALPFHAGNLLLHALNSCLVLLFLRVFLKHRTAALICAVLFAVHPLHAETVAWASARKDLLATAGMLGTVLAYMHWHHAGDRRWYGASIGLLTAGLLAKISAIAAVPVLWLLHWKDRHPQLRILWPHIVIGCVFALIAVAGKTQPLGATGPLTMVLLACRSVLFALGKFLLPVHLSPLYPAPEVIAPDDPATLAAVAAVGLLVLGALWLGHRHRDVAFCWWWFFVSLAPSFLNASKGGILFIGSDRYMYAASVGLLAMFGLGIRRLCTAHGTFSRRRERVVLTWSMIVAMGLGIVSARQASIWKNSVDLFAHAALETPDFALAHYFLGNAYRNAGDADLAITAYKASLLRDPSNARTHAHLGHAYAEKGMDLQAAEEYGRALTLNPDRADAHFGLGVIYGRWGQHADAAAEYRRALALLPDYPDASLNLGALLGEQGDLEGEIAVYADAIAMNPEHALLRYNMGVALEKDGRINEARASYQESLRLSPELPFPAAALERLLKTQNQN